MTYAKHTWNAGKAGGTPITAVKLNEMEDGIAAAATTAGVAADVANPESTIGSALSDTIVTVGQGQFAGLSAARPGNRVAFLGDSITQASWQNSSQSQGASYPLFAMMSSGGRLLVAANAGLSGDTSAQALARFDTQVTPSNPTTVMILLGTNDIHGGGVTLTSFAANIQAIVAKARAIGATPIIGTIPPNNTGSTHALINTWNAWLRRYAASQAIEIVDFYQLLADPANGNYSSTYATDGTHPNTAGYIAMGQLVATVMNLPAWAPYMSQDNTDALNSLTATNSIMLTDATADGVPDGWFAYGGSAGYTHALVTDAAVRGKMAQITQTANASLRSLQKSVSSVSVGDKIAISGVVTTDGGVGAQVKVTFTGAGTSSSPLTFTGAIVRGVFYQEVTVPAATTGVTIDLMALAGTGVVAYGQVTVVNLTTNALL